MPLCERRSVGWNRRAGLRPRPEIGGPRPEIAAPRSETGRRSPEMVAPHPGIDASRPEIAGPGPERNRRRHCACV
eukprot:scaffold20149_cov45-Isochrysis_galbana.AAC.1